MQLIQERVTACSKAGGDPFLFLMFFNKTLGKRGGGGLERFTRNAQLNRA